MKKILLLLLLSTFSATLFGQTTTSIEFTKDKELLLNGVVLSANSTMDDIQKILGDPEIYKEYVTGKTNYHYKELGISVHAMDNQLLFIGANFNWDGDKTFPKTSFMGTCKIGGISFDLTSSEKEVNKIDVVELISVMPGLYMSNPKIDKVAIILGVKEDLVTQIGFEFQ